MKPKVTLKKQKSIPTLNIFMYGFLAISVAVIYITVGHITSQQTSDNSVQAQVSGSTPTPTIFQKCLSHNDCSDSQFCNEATRECNDVICETFPVDSCVFTERLPHQCVHGTKPPGTFCKAGVREGVCAADPRGICITRQISNFDSTLLQGESEVVSHVIFYKYSPNISVSRVDFFIDGNLVNRDKSAPYYLGESDGQGTPYGFNTKKLTNGNHKLKVRAVSSTVIEEDSIDFKVNNR